MLITWKTASTHASVLHTNMHTSSTKLFMHDKYTDHVIINTTDNMWVFVIRYGRNELRNWKRRQKGGCGNLYLSEVKS